MKALPLALRVLKTSSYIDLDVENVTLPATGEVYKEVVLAFTVMNRGTATFEWATYGKGVQWAIGSLGYGVQHIRTISDGCHTVNIAPLSGCDVRVSLIFSDAGTKTVPLTIDPNNLVSEITKTNNIHTKSIVILPTPTTLNQSITITSPNGGEEWHQGETKRITWNSVDVDVVNISIYDFSKSTSFIDGSFSIAAKIPNNKIVNTDTGYYD